MTVRPIAQDIIIHDYQEKYNLSYLGNTSNFCLPKSAFGHTFVVMH